MRIMYLLFSFTVGGAEELVVDLCNEMVAQKQDVYLYIVNDYYSKSLIRKLSKKVHVELQNRKAGSGGKAETLFRVSKYIYKNKIDVVHCNSLNAPELLLFKPVLYPKARIVHTIHDVGQYSSLPKWKIIFRNKLCDSFVAISDSVKNDLVEAGADSQKIRVVYNAIDLKKFQNNRKKNFDKNRIVIGNVARIMPEKKGQDVLVAAIERLKKVYPEIVCEFAGAYDAQHKIAYENLKNEVRLKGLSKNIRFLGNIENIPSFLGEIDIFVLPSRYEGFGISLIEAMSMGIPCIASNLDGPAEIIGNNERGELFQVGDVDELVTKIEQVVDHYSEYQGKQIKIREYICKNFDIHEMSKKMISIYIGEE